MTKMFIDEVHAQNVLQRMWEQSERKEYCDIALISGDTEEMKISAHRAVLSASCEYFKTMFTPPFNESTAKEVKLPNVDGESLKSLVKFCYSGRLEMNEDNAEKLLITADSLLLDAVVNACGDFLSEQLDLTNCFGMAQLAERHRCDSLTKKAKDFCTEHFVELYKTDEFLNISVEQLAHLLSSDDLRDPTEEHVFKSLMLWLEHDRSEREQHKDDMLKLVRLPLLNPTFLFDQVKPVCTSLTSLNLFMKATELYVIPERRTGTASKFTTPRRSDARLMAITEANNKLNILYHCPQQLKWMKWLENLEYSNNFAVAILGDNLFVVGGELVEISLNSVICINLKTMLLRNVNPMNERRSAPGVAVLNGSLYAVGGWNGNSNISSVEMWDLNSNTWTMVTSMSVSRHAFGITVFNEKFYVVGGSVSGENTGTSSAECYNPLENVWTSIASLCVARVWPELTVVNGILYAVGGNGKLSIERYDPETDKWTITCIRLSESLTKGYCTVIFDKLIALYEDRVEEHNIKTNEWKVNTYIAGLENECCTFSFSGSLLEPRFIEN